MIQRPRLEKGGHFASKELLRFTLRRGKVWGFKTVLMFLLLSERDLHWLLCCGRTLVMGSSSRLPLPSSAAKANFPLRSSCLWVEKMVVALSGIFQLVFGEQPETSF